MTNAGEYFFEVDESSSAHIRGWAFHTKTTQPVEIVFKAGETALFSVAANEERIVSEDARPRRAGFDVAIDRNIWRVVSELSVCTPDGNIISVIEKPVAAVRIRREFDAIEHQFTSLNLVEISGKFSIPEQDEKEHFVKLHSDGKLIAYAAASRSSDGIDDRVVFDYEFRPSLTKPLLKRLVLVTINDRFVFVGGPHSPLTLPGDETRYLLPLPFDIASVLTTETVGADTANQVLLYSTKHYLGFGGSSVLVFGRKSDFTINICHEEHRDVCIVHKGGNLTITQIA